MKRAVLVCVSTMCLLCMSCGNESVSSRAPALELTLRDTVPVLNAAWVKWIWAQYNDSVDTHYAKPVSDLYAKLSEQLAPSVFNVSDYVDTAYLEHPFVLAYHENLDEDSVKEFVFVIGGLSANSLLFVLKPVQGNYHMIYRSRETFFYENSALTFLHQGKFSLFETVSEPGGTTDIGSRLHTVYRLVDGNIRRVLAAKESVDLSGTLKVKTSIHLFPRDSSGNEDGIIVHYNACYWLCHAYDAEHLSPKGEESWDLYRNGTCDLAEGIVLLNKRYGLLYSWSPDSLKYLPVYSPYGLSKEQHDIIEGVNSSEEYAHAFFTAFKSDIDVHARRTTSTLEWLDKRFDLN